MAALLLLFIVLPILGFVLFRNTRKGVSASVKVGEYILILLFAGAGLLFLFGLAHYSADYTEAIDIVDGGYTPFAYKHIPVLVIPAVGALWGIIRLWRKGRSLPPIQFVLALTCMLIGIIGCMAFLAQVSSNTDQYSSGVLFLFLPIMYIIVCSILVMKIVLQEANRAADRTYKNKVLNYLNTMMADSRLQPFWALLLVLPLLVFMMAILVLFGQDTAAFTKVFTETTTWQFSQKTHPPFLDHRGHYLCTVAACGDPQIVKPIGIGMRHGKEIIINRQLQIANAFEALIEERYPSFHKTIRRLYDTYGYPLSQKITKPRQFNFVYHAMKPLEYLFVITLYTFCEHPEEKIKQQYA